MTIIGTKRTRSRGSAAPIVALLLAAACGPATEQPAVHEGATGLQASAAPRNPDYRPFTLEQARSFHRRFEPSFLTWATGGELTRYVYLHMSEFWPQIAVRATGTARPLPVATRDDVAGFAARTAGGEVAVRDYLRSSPTDAAIVLHQGRIVFEDYSRMLPTDRHILFSVSKTLVSTAVAILEDQGQVASDAPIERYLPRLAGTAWAGTPVIDLLDMASGIDCREIHQEADGCFWRFYDGFGWPMADRASDDPMAAVARMGRLQPSGQLFDYTSVDTEVLNWMIEAVSGLRYGDFVEREIWQRAGPEADALITTTPNGDAFSAGGVSMRLRDLARYGMLFTPSGRRGEAAPAISDAYLRKIQTGGRPDLMTAEQREGRRARLGDESTRHNTYQWDIVTTDGDFYKGGVGGQGLYVSPSRDLVIAWFATPTETGEQTEMLAIARQLATSGLFGEPASP
ncbi:MAG: serine hydrolase domain-containing protein [Gemmatimonadales bacterium]